jgi:hypothetical protein
MVYKRRIRCLKRGRVRQGMRVKRKKLERNLQVVGRRSFYSAGSAFCSCSWFALGWFLAFTVLLPSFSPW